MVKFRRSVKSEKDVKTNHISIPQKDAIAIVPPKKVIKALYDYQAPVEEKNMYLSFSQGDFLHVVSRENDPDWYEACNPLLGTRGLVPVKYFDVVGKTARDSGGSTKSAGGTHDSGYAEKPGRGSTTGATDSGASTLVNSTPSSGSSRLSRQGKSGAMVYGIVQYDFKAERPDELEAKEGEAIIVIAQSNPEWFVAKPITRLGGPGLIPVSFVEIKDMVTGKTVEDPQAAVKAAGVPKVEEWKKMAADYKNGSIPLGRLDSNQSQAPMSQLQQGMDRLSVGAASQKNGYGAAGGYGHQRTQSYAQRHAEQLLAPVYATVPRYCFADENFWFIVEAQMEDGRHWELSRFYKDFYDLQINLIKEYPLEAGNVKGYDRSLPYMPGPVTYVTDNISNGRRANLDEYLRNLFKLGPHITKGYLVRKFFAPREGDYEIDPTVQTNDYRLSAASQRSSDPSSQAAASRQSSQGNLAQYPNHQRAPSTQYNQGYPTHSRHTSDIQTQRPPMLRDNSTLTATSATSAASSTALKIKVWFEEDNCVVLRMPQHFSYKDLYQKLKERRKLEKQGGGGGGGEEDEDEDEEEGELVIEYRDEVEGEFYRIEGDEDLAFALERVNLVGGGVGSKEGKLTLTVTVVP